jgi:hypothetical protein
MKDEVTDINQTIPDANKKVRRNYFRSPYLFPAYDMNEAIKVTRIIDTQGAGTLSEPLLAMALGLSAKSSGFALRIGTAKQFGLIERKGDNLCITELAKGVFRPVGEDEKKASLARSFYNVELFKAVVDRFKGVPLPSDNDLRNLLEREFGVKRDRVGQAFSTLINSAKTAGVLHESQGKVYLSQEPSPVKAVPERKPEEGEESLPASEPLSSEQKIEPITATWNVSVDTKDLMGMDAEAIKAALEGLERLAKIIVLKQKTGE